MHYLKAAKKHLRTETITEYTHLVTGTLFAKAKKGGQLILEPRPYGVPPADYDLLVKEATEHATATLAIVGVVPSAVVPNDRPESNTVMWKTATTMLAMSCTKTEQDNVLTVTHIQNERHVVGYDVNDIEEWRDLERAALMLHILSCVGMDNIDTIELEVRTSVKLIDMSILEITGADGVAVKYYINDDAVLTALHFN